MLKAIDPIVNPIMALLTGEDNINSAPNITRFCRFLFVLLLYGSFLNGCGLSPQSIALNPLIDVRTDPIGRGRILALSVRDQRPQQAFGSRGGVYDTALITPRTEVAQAVYSVLEERLRASGFNVVSGHQGSEPSMQVVIQRIDYVVNETSGVGGPLVNEVRVHAIIEAIVGNVGTNRNGHYQANSARRQVGYLSALDNEAIINEVIAEALKQLLQDANILSLLAQ